MPAPRTKITRRAGESDISLIRRLVAQAVGFGRLPRVRPCESCGRPGKVRHHWSYRVEHALDVICLCGSCHVQMHLGAIPEPRTGRMCRRGERVVPTDTAPPSPPAHPHDSGNPGPGGAFSQQ